MNNSLESIYEDGTINTQNIFQIDDKCNGSCDRQLSFSEY